MFSRNPQHNKSFELTACPLGKLQLNSDVRPHRVVACMSTDSVAAYEKHSQTFLQCRDTSKVGVQVTNRWAHSLEHGSEVIEIACGGGVPVTQVLVDAGLKVWAIDSSPTLITVFKNRFPDIPVKCNTVLKSDYFRRKYDAAISIGLIFLLNEKDQIEMLAKVSEILHTGASFLFTAPIEIGTWTDVNTGHACISLGQEAYERALERSGFRVVGCYEDCGKNNYYEAEKNR